MSIRRRSLDAAAATADSEGHVYVRPSGQTLPAWRRRVSRYTPEHFGAVGHSTTDEAVTANVSASAAIQRGIAVAALDNTSFHFPPRAYALGEEVDIDVEVNITSDAAAWVCALPGAIVGFRVIGQIQTSIQLPSIGGFATAAVHVLSLTADAAAADVTAHDVTSCGIAVRLQNVSNGSVCLHNITEVGTVVTFEHDTSDTIVKTHRVLGASNAVIAFPDSTVGAEDLVNAFSARSALDVRALVRCTHPETVGRLSVAIECDLYIDDPAAPDARLVDGNFTSLAVVAVVDDLRRHHVSCDTLDSFEARLTSARASPVVTADSVIDLNAPALSETTLHVAAVPETDLAAGETLTAYIQHILGGARWTASCTSPTALALAVSDVGDGSSVRVDVTNVGNGPIPAGTVLKMLLRRV
jgi:hypothetical protein